MLDGSSVWDVLIGYNNGEIGGHTLTVCLKSTQNPYFDDLTDSEKNVVRWSSLFHDLAKRGKSCDHGRDIVMGRDHVHPFRGGKLCLQLFHSLDFFEITGEDQHKAYNRLLDLID